MIKKVTRFVKSVLKVFISKLVKSQNYLINIWIKYNQNNEWHHDLKIIIVIGRFLIWLIPILVKWFLILILIPNSPWADFKESLLRAGGKRSWSCYIRKIVRNCHFSAKESELKNHYSAADSWLRLFCQESVESRIGIDQSLNNNKLYPNYRYVLILRS